MAEKDTGQERTERATPRRQQQARDKGQVARSRELMTFTLLVSGAGGLLVLGGGLVDAILRVMRASFRFSPEQLGNPGSAPLMLGDALVTALSSMAPLLTLLVAAAVLSSVVLGGVRFAAEGVMPKFDRISPAKGFKRIFSAQGVMELVKALAKFLLIGSVALWWMWHDAENILLLGELPVESGLAHAAYLVGWAFLVVSLATILVAAVDVPFQLWQHARQLRMTKQEVRDEMKETEGKPEVKQQIRRLQQEMARRRMMQEVPKADVIVTNPTHYAVALRYEAGRMRAPTVVAKGAGLVAARIRAIGVEHKVALYEAPPLARALYFSTDLGQEIPAGLYLAVAQVLAYIFQLRDPRPGDKPTAPADLPIPPELRRDA